jgi:hypothetical protein
MTLNKLLIQDGLVLCSNQELELFLLHLLHRTIIAKGGQDVRVKDLSKFPKPIEGKYDLQVVKSLLI